jgi:HAE1 family hydrophobic/amphiphilic exporter-1
VGENIFRHREIGRSPLDAAQHGIDEVGLSLVSAYLTTFAAFGPMYLVRGVMGDFMSVLPTVVVLALVAAMLVDHYLLPVLSVYVMNAKQSTSKFTELLKQSESDDADPSKQLTPAQFEIMSAEISAEATRVQRVYGRMLRYCLNHRLLVISMSVILAIMPAVLYASGAIGTNFFPEGDIPIVEVDFEPPLGSSMEHRSVEVAATVEHAINKAVRPEEWYNPAPNIPAVGPVTTIGEPGALNIRLDLDQGTGPEFGMVYVELELAEHRDRSAAEIRRAIEAELPPLPGQA